MGGDGGWQYVFLLPEGESVPTKTLGPGVEIRGEGAYVLWPPSVHPDTGLARCFADETSPAVFPLFLLNGASVVAGPNGTPPVIAQPVDGVIPSGQRNQTLTSLAGTMRRRGMKEDAIHAALTVTNERQCQPPLPDREVARIAESVSRYEPDVPLGEVRLLPAPTMPMAVARRVVADLYTVPPSQLVLRHWRGGWWRWQTSHWGEIEDRAIRAVAYRYTEHAEYESKDAHGNVVVRPWSPNRHRIIDLLDALRAVTLSSRDDEPGWFEKEHVRGVIVACANGLLDVESRRLYEHTPLFFNQTAVPFDYDPTAAPPARWLAFLDELWQDDGGSIGALQEFFGYVISGRLDLQKILLIVGPTRAGKGVIARVLGALVGRENVAGPTLSSLGHDFGLAPLLGKPLAVISDARLNGRDSHVVVERLLSVSGEDTLTVNRKYREQWTGKLPTRIVVISNELPRLGDASAAIAGRFVALLLTRTWLGHEDMTLERELHAELPGILNWGLDGLARLGAQGRFTEPPSTTEAFIAMQDLASPVAAFVRDRCQVGLGMEVLVDELWGEWKGWCEADGHRTGTKQVFGRDLRAVIPGLRVARPGEHSAARVRVYRGVGLSRRNNG